MSFDYYYLQFLFIQSETVKEEGLVISGVDVTKLADAELQTFCKALDEEFAGKLDLHVFKSTLAERHGRRQRRFIFTALALFAGKMLFKSYVVSKVATLGSIGAAAAKVYTVYDTVDTVRDVYDTFNDLRPDNVERSEVQTENDGLETVLTGEIENVNVTARSYGPSGVPTLQLSDDKVIREIRFRH
ncbi:hypothetical protein FSP39_001161 [Pinctada imbricata]|uniref:Uncharacterized protein n=1 Tax=Pinctada imbricata TaxID=66713 RepID=A0AA88YIK2_PINIB|nr:hypothetical protein FSP39_001161 [Pinctada imbricata]